MLDRIKTIDWLKVFPLIIVASLALFVFYYGLGSYALANNNEGLYAEIAREILAMNSYVIPKLNYVPYIEKPPLLYWLISLSYKIFGVSTWAARLVPATCGFLTCVGVLLFGYFMNLRRQAWIATFILCSSLGFVLIAHIVFFDMLLTACLTFALLSFYRWYAQRHRSSLRLAYVFLGLATLAKGLLAMLLVPSIAIVFLLLQKGERTRVLELFDGLGILLLLIIIVPWHILAIVVHPGFAWDYFMNEQFLRFFNERIPHDYYTGPLYYYLPRILIYLFPWSLLLPILFTSSKVCEDQSGKIKTFLWLWFIIPLLFFSLSKAKANYYMIIAMPALALLLAMKIEKYVNENKSRLLTMIFIGVTSFLPLGLFYSWHYHIIVLETPLAYLFISILIVYLCGGVLLCRLNPQKALVPFLLIGGLIVPVDLFAMSAMRHIQDNISEKQLAAFILTQGESQPIYVYQDFEKLSSFLFYSQRRLIIVDSTSDDLLYGAKAPEAKGWFLSKMEFLEHVKNERVSIIVLTQKLPDFYKFIGELPFDITFQNKNVTLLKSCIP